MAHASLKFSLHIRKRERLDFLGKNEEEGEVIFFVFILTELFNEKDKKGPNKHI